MMGRASAVAIVLLGVITHRAFSLKKQFYPSIVHMMSDNVSLMIVYAQLAILAVGAARLLHRVFFGQLRPMEVEHLYDRSWFAVTETCLAMTIFRNEFDVKFAGLFGLLLAMKTYHWVAQDRVEYMEQTPNISWKFHARMIITLSTLMVLDASLIYVAVTSLIAHGPSMQLLFGFEYIVLLTINVATLFKYILQSVDLQSEQPWENKVLYIFYLDLMTDFVKLAVYLLFFVILMNFYGLPLHIIRDLFMTFQSFVKRLRDFRRSRQATRDMNRYPDASVEDLAATDAVCIVCREEMVHGKKLPCGHIFHVRCLRSWLQMQQNCPTCRANVLEFPQPARRPREQPPPAPALPQGLLPRDNVPNHPAAPAPAVNHRNRQNAEPQARRAASPVAAPGTPPVAAAHGAGAYDQAEMPADGHPQPFMPPFLSMPPPFGMPMPPQFYGMHAGSPAGFPAPFMMPPFMPYGRMQPPPRMSADDVSFLSTLNPTDLATMEGMEAANMAARIAFLRNLRHDLDTLLSRYDQFQAVNPMAQTSQPSFHSYGSPSPVPRTAPRSATAGLWPADYVATPTEAVRQSENAEAAASSLSTTSDHVEDERRAALRQQRLRHFSASDPRSDGDEEEEELART